MERHNSRTTMFHKEKYFYRSLNIDLDDISGFLINVKSNMMIEQRKL